MSEQSTGTADSQPSHLRRREVAEQADRAHRVPDPNDAPAIDALRRAAAILRSMNAAEVDAGALAALYEHVANIWAGGALTHQQWPYTRRLVLELAKGGWQQ